MSNVGNGRNLDDPDKTASNCAICSRPDHDESQMVFCDNCQQWFHFSCVGVNSAVEYEEDWSCPTCLETASDPVEEEMDEAMKAVAEERKRLKQDMEKKLKLAQMKIDLENAKREMQWAMEKKVLEMKIASERAFNKKREAERKKLQQDWDQLVQQRKQVSEKKTKSSKSNKARKDDTGNPEDFGNGNPSNSTPISQPGSSNSTQPKDKKNNDRHTTPDENVDGNDKDDSGEDSGSDESSTSSSTSESDSSEESDHSDKDEEKKDGKMKVPTKSQLSARQFLSRKLPTFTGRPEDWPMFSSSYETSTKACGFSNLENLARLQECLKGAARDAVSSRLLLPDAVPQVMETLRMLYGRPEQLLDTLLLKVRRADPPKSDKLTSFITFGVLVQQLCDHIEAANMVDHLVNPMLIRELVEKLPSSTKIDWVRYKRQTAKVTLRTLADFLSDLISAASEVVNYVDVTPQASGSKSGKVKNSKGKEQDSYVHAHSGSDGAADNKKQDRTPCAMCGQTNHRLRNCDNFRKLSVPQRWGAVEKWELCQICLNSHGKAKCKLNIRCTVGDCSERHNSLLHPVETQSNCNTHSDFSKDSILFRMVPVRIFNGDRSVTTVAFLDEGSSYSLIDSSLTRKLQCNGTTQPLRITWTAGVSRLEKDSQRLQLTIAACGSNEKFILRDVHTVNNLKLPAQSMSFADVAGKYRHLKGLPVTNYAPSTPMLLIGLKHIEIFAPLESRIGRPGEPIAVRSKLGWTIYGPQGTTQGDGFLGQHSCAGLSNEELHDLLKSQYALDEKGVSVDVLPESDEDRRAREILEERTVRVGDRFVTGLIWKEDNPTFPDSFPMALRRMKSLEKKLSTNPQLEEAVKQQIVQYQEKGYCHKATKAELNSANPEKVWYLPLNVVLNPKKPGKVRLVWDAAAEVNGVSLNSKLLKGPDYLTSLPSVIVKFREYPIGFGGDIREMFHQLKIRPEDKQALWFVFGNEVYVMDCAIFGASCSPSTAMFVKDRNARDFAEQFPEASEAIVNKHYVDDYFDSTATVEEAIQRASEVRLIHSKGGFEIRNWVSNSPVFLERMGETEKNQTVHLDSTNPERVLGIVWSTKEDVFTFTTRMRDSLLPYLCDGKLPTKRVVLSCVMSLFDPLGLLAPFTYFAKVLIQLLWRMGCEWDQIIEGEALEDWKLWTSNLGAVEAVKIPRYYFGDGLSLDYSTLQLHMFADASEKAYGCVGYFRILAGGVPRCALVQAKSKVAPVKQVSIPRLELMAAVLGCRLADTIRENHSLVVRQVFYWTDSRTVHSWIVSDQRKYKSFVAFRIGEIISRSQPSEWRWVPTKLNVADQLTKWNNGPQLGSDSSWIRGPQFLYRPESEWPLQQLKKPNVEEEMRTTFLLHDVEVQGQLVDVSRFSKWNVLVRTLACVKRFIDNLQAKRKGKAIVVVPATPKVKALVLKKLPVIEKPLAREEFKFAERILLKLAQVDAYPDEVRALLKSRQAEELAGVKLEKSSPLYKLSPILDEFDVIRMEGRLAAAEFLPFELRYPIVLPKGHQITRRLLEHYHQKFGHAGRETVTNEVRQRFYIPHLRAEMRKVMDNCVRCKTRKCKPEAPRMAPLPVQRVTPNLRPFSFTGVDFFGPLLVTVGQHVEKRWVALFTCLVTRAIHLEVAHSLSSQACLMAIRRFACRRGMPTEFLSDNGTNFVAASKEVMQNIVMSCNEAFTDARTKWNFNPPAAPHMGGAWERLVRSAKEALSAMNDGRKLTDEVLLTVLAEAEDAINSRPLTYMSQESDTEEALSPNHFLRGYPPGGVESYVVPANEAEALRNNYKRSQLLADKLWQRWLLEYLPFINKRTKWYVDQESIKPGAVVYLADNENRKTWVRGVVEEVVKGIDGRVRQALVRTTKGIYKRPVAKLAVPEFGSCKSGSNPGSTPELRGGAVAAPLGTLPDDPSAP